MTRRVHRFGFTLIELVVVVSLMCVTVGMVVFRLDGVSDRGRLRSTATQMAVLLRLAQTQARTSGVPRLMRYHPSSDRVSIHVPAEREGVWDWNEGLEFLTATGAGIERVLIEGHHLDGEEDRPAIRIGADGRYPNHVVILSTPALQAIVVARGAEDIRCEFLASPLEGISYELLVLELEQSGERPTG